MARRFLTSEDVSRAGGAEIVVDASTVVTPQAQETARAAGVTIRVASGAAWTEPEPDRGPDALSSAAQLPHLPEPSEGGHAGDPAPTGIVVTAVGRNRPGVLAEITAQLARLGLNIHDVSQRVVEGYFHMVLVVEPTEVRDFSELKTTLECMGSPEDYAVSVMHERAFRFMHRL